MPGVPQREDAALRSREAGLTVTGTRHCGPLWKKEAHPAMMAEWAIVMRDPFDDGRSLWARTFTPRESGYLAVAAVLYGLIILAFALL